MILDNIESNIANGESVPVTAYKSARAVAGLVESHFERHHQSVSKYYDQELAPKPDAKTIEAIIDTTFWASLRREEGRSPKISIAFIPPECAVNPLVFGEKLPFTSNTLTKLAPAVERSGIHLGVWMEDDLLYIWGTTRVIPGLCFVLEVIEPGMLVIKHRRVDGFGKFVNVAVLKGDQVKIVDEESGSVRDCPSIINSMIGFTSPNLWNDSLNLLVQLFHIHIFGKLDTAVSLFHFFIQLIHFHGQYFMCHLGFPPLLMVFILAPTVRHVDSQKFQRV